MIRRLFAGAARGAAIAGNAITIAVLTVSAMLEFLKLQEGVQFSPEVLLVLGVLSVGLNMVARFLPAPTQPIAVAVSGAPGQPGVGITDATAGNRTPEPVDEPEVEAEPDPDANLVGRSYEG